MKRFPPPIAVDLSAWAARVGAVVDGEGGYRLETKVGPLWVKPIAATTGGAWIAARFEDVEAARRHFGVSWLGTRLNPYSGKWNFTEGLGAASPEAVEYMVRVFEDEVGRLL